MNKKSLKTKRQNNETATPDERRAVIKSLFESYDITSMKELSEILKAHAKEIQKNEDYFSPESVNTIYRDMRYLEFDFHKNTKWFNEMRLLSVKEQIEYHVTQIRLNTLYGEYIFYPTTDESNNSITSYKEKIYKALFSSNQKISLYSTVHLLFIFKNNNYLELVKNTFYRHTGILYSTIHDRAIELVFEYNHLDDILPDIITLLPDNIPTRNDIFSED